MKISDAIGYYLDNFRGKRPDAAAQALKHPKRLLGDTLTEDLAAAALNDYRKTRLADGVCDATANREISMLRATLRLALHDELIDKVPRFPLVRERNVRRKYFTIDQMDSVARLLDSYQLGNLIRFAFFVGWRKSAIFGLTWDCANWAAEQLTLPPELSKNGNAVVAEIYGPIREILLAQQQRQVSGCPFVFHRKGKQIKDIMARFKWALGVTGLEGRIFHDLRRSMATHYAEAGVDHLDIMALGGWETPSVFKRYSISTRKRQRNALDLASNGFQRRMAA